MTIDLNSASLRESKSTEKTRWRRRLRPQTLLPVYGSYLLRKLVSIHCCRVRKWLGTDVYALTCGQSETIKIFVVHPRVCDIDMLARLKRR